MNMGIGADDGACHGERGDDRTQRHLDRFHISLLNEDDDYEVAAFNRG